MDSYTVVTLCDKPASSDVESVAEVEPIAIFPGYAHASLLKTTTAAIRKGVAPNIVISLH